MSEQAGPADIAKRPVVFRLPGMDAVEVRQDLEYRPGSSALTLDVYRPPGAEGERLPVVVLVAGYPDPGLAAVFGCRFKEMAQSVSWGQLIAVSGMAAIAYTNEDPVADLHALLAHLRENGAALGIDTRRIALWASSGNVPLALSVAMGGDLRCAVLCNGLMLDLDGATRVSEASAQFGFANPTAGKSVDDLPADLSLFLVRSGQDEIPGLNDTIDAFLAAAGARGLPLTLVNHARAPHAFDINHDSETSREIIRQILAFLRSELL